MLGKLIVWDGAVSKARRALDELKSENPNVYSIPLNEFK